MRNFNKIMILVMIIFSCTLLSACFNHQHSMQDWEIKIPATCTQNQILSRKCRHCNFEQTKTGEKLSHSYTQNVIAPTTSSNGFTSYTCKYCGDSYKNNQTCLLTFECVSNNELISDQLPYLESKIVYQNSIFEGISNTYTLKVKQYYLISDNYKTPIYVGDKITSSCLIQVVWDEKILSQEEIDFNNLVSKIKILENLSYSFNPENHQLRTLQFIRNSRYNSSQWNMFGGTIETDFIEYVSKNQGNSDLFELQTLEFFVTPIQNQHIDFVHMIAIMNVIQHGGFDNQTRNDMVGFGGDLCQFTNELKTSGLTGNELQNFASSKFGTKNSTFSEQDLLADLDAINIMKIYKTTTDSCISKSILDYYYSINKQSRKLQFLNNVFSENYSSTNTLAAKIFERISGNLYIIIWCNQNDLSFSDHQEYFMSAINCFSNYFFN